MASDPIPFVELARHVEERSRLTPAPPVALTKSIFVAGVDPSVEPSEPTIVEGGELPDGARTFRVDVELRQRAVGVHAFPPPMLGTALAAGRELLTEDDAADLVTPFLPDHLDLRLSPLRLDPRFVQPRRLDHRRRPGVKLATAIFNPDQRYTFNDTAYPWCCCGAVGPTGASGVMVGPRHVLTVSHGIRWINPPNPHVAEWVQFTPAAFDTSEPFGTAYSTHVYWQQQVAGPTIDGTEGQFDYAVVVLDRPIGELTGWMGSRSYTDSWDGGAYWSHIGYPGDLASGSRPSFQGSISLNGDDAQPDANEEMLHMGDVWPGQSGGPYFGWWDGDVGPRVVSVQSWERYKDAAQTIPDVNGASGGSSLVDLVIRARTDFP